MDEQEFSDFLMAFGQEFCWSLGPIVGSNGIVPQDAYEVFLRVFELPPSPRVLASLTEQQLEQMRTGFECYLEYEGVTIEQIRAAISRTLIRWPDSKP